MSSEEKNERQISQQEIEALHELITQTDAHLQKIAIERSPIFGMALMALATFIVEKVYLCSPEMDNAVSLLAKAQDQGIDNWIAEVERQRTQADEPQVIVPN